MRGLLVIIGLIGIGSLSFAPLHAATIETIRAQINTYHDSGAITDSDLVTAMHNTLDMAQAAQNAQDADAEAAYYNSLKDSIDEAAGDAIHSDAAAGIHSLIPVQD